MSLRWFDNNNDIICVSIDTYWRHSDIPRDEADVTCPNSGSLICAQPGSFILRVSFWCFVTHNDTVVCILYLIKPLPVKSYYGKQICIPLSDIPLFQDTQHETSCVHYISFINKYEETCFVSHNEDVSFVGLMRGCKPLFENDCDNVSGFFFYDILLHIKIQGSQTLWQKIGWWL